MKQIILPKKKSEIDPKKIISVAKNIIESYEPEFESLTPKLKNKLRVRLHKNYRDAILDRINNDLYAIGIADSPNHQNLEPDQQSQFTCRWCYQYITGIGDNYLRISDHLPSHIHIKYTESIYDLDAAYFKDQSAYGSSQQANSYSPLLWPFWITFIADEQFHYASLASSAGYIAQEIERFGLKAISELMPDVDISIENEVDLGINDNKEAFLFFELFRKIKQYAEDLGNDLNKQFNDSAPKVFIATNKDGQSCESSHTFIFQNTNTLKDIGWQKFIHDCEQHYHDFSEIQPIIDEEKEKVILFAREKIDFYGPLIIGKKGAASGSLPTPPLFDPSVTDEESLMSNFDTESIVWIDNDLIAAAEKARPTDVTIDQQIEFWADLGKTIETLLDQKTNTDVDMTSDDLIALLEKSLQEGSLQKELWLENKYFFNKSGNDKYPIIRQEEATGIGVFGNFKNGRFVPRK